MALVVCLLPCTAKAADGDPTVVLDADFTQFTQGSPASPVDFPSYGTGSFSSYFSGWMASKVAQAGGSLMIKDGGYVRTKSVNISANNGTVRVTGRVKFMDSYGGIVKISCGYSSSNSQQVMLQDSAWHTVTVIVGGGTAAGNVRMEPFLSVSGMLVQTLKVEQSPLFIASPEAQQPVQADGKSFTARWRKVSGATAYILNVYSYSGNEKVYRLRDENVGDVLSYQVKDLDPKTTYYFTVSATNGTGVSEPSGEIKVIKVIYSLATPKNLTVKTTEDRVTGSWEAVEDAQYYVMTVDRIYTCSADQEVEILGENFDKIATGELESIDFFYRDNLDAYTNATGWTGSDLGLAKGHMVLTPFSGDTASLVTPVLDLKGKTGAFTCTARMACGAFGSYYPGEVEFALLNAAGDTLELKKLTLEKDFAVYNVNFTAGMENCRVAMMYHGDYKIFVDNVTIRQIKAKGQRVISFLGEKESEGLSASLIAERGDNIELSVRVMAAAETVSVGDITTIYSQPSEAVVVKFVTGAVGGVEDDGQSVIVDGSAIHATVGNPTEAAVYDVNGRILYKGILQAGTTVMEVRSKGVVVMTVGNKAYKLMIK